MAQVRSRSKSFVGNDITKVIGQCNDFLEEKELEVTASALSAITDKGGSPVFYLVIFYPERK